MQKKLVLITVCSLALILALGATSALAASTTEQPQGTGMFGGAGKFHPDMGNMPGERLQEMDEEMTAKHAEMEAQMKAQMEERQAQWDALSAADKAELLDLQRQMLQTQQQMLDKYLALGLIGTDEAGQMQERIDEMLVKLDGGDLSMVSGWPGGGFGQRIRMELPENAQ